MKLQILSTPIENIRNKYRMAIAQRSSYSDTETLTDYEFRMKLAPTAENTIIFDFDTVRSKVNDYIKKNKLPPSGSKPLQPHGINFVAFEIYTKTGASIESRPLCEGSNICTLTVHFFDAQRTPKKQLSKKTEEALAIAREILA